MFLFVGITSEEWFTSPVAKGGSFIKSQFNSGGGELILLKHLYVAFGRFIGGDVTIIQIGIVRFM